MSFIGVIQQFVDRVSPWFIRGKNTGAFLQANAIVLDEAIQSLSAGLYLSQPLRCDASALPVLSRDRSIRIYDTEPEESQRYRLSRWWQLHRQRGTHQGELRNLQPVFLPASPLMRIVHQDGAGGRATWHTLATDGTYSIHKAEPSNWDFDGVPAKWSRWWCILYREAAMGYLDAALWDGGASWDDGTLWDGGPSTEQIADIVSALKEAQSAHSKLWGVIMTSEPASFDPTATAVTDPDGWTSLPVGNWGFAIDNDTGLPSRPPYASFLFNEGQG